MKAITQTLATPGQIKQINRFGSDAIEKVLGELGLDNPGAQRVIEHGDEFAEAIHIEALTSLKDLSVSDRYADEEVSSSYTYPTEYEGPKSIEEQIKATAEIFELDSTQALKYAKELPELPSGAEGWFAIPNIDALAQKHFPEVTNPGEKYCRTVRLVHEKIGASRKFYNYRDGQITPVRLRIHSRTAQALSTLSENQPGDILIIAAQLGMSHRGRSTRSARECFVANEFGLTSLAVGSITLTHPERLVRWEELDMDCAGEEFDDPDADVRFDHAPYFDFGDGGIKFGTNRVDNVSGLYGSASGFVPQS